MNRLLLIALAAVVMVSGAGCVDRETLARNEKTKEVTLSKQIPVMAKAFSPQDVNETVEVTGQFQVEQDSSVGAQIAGRLTSVYVKEGDSVSAGQVIAVQETADLQSRLNQALSQAAAARAQLSQAQADAAAAPQRTSAAVRAAEARVAQAKQRLAKLRNGSRSEEKAQAEAQVARAESDMKTAKAVMERARRLFAEGALAKADVEASENRYDNAMAAYKAAIESRSIVKDPIREEDMKVAEQDLAASQEALRIEKTTKSLDVTYRDRVDAAKANLRSAEESIKLARKALGDATIRAPYSGRIVGRPAQPGTVLGPGSPVARIVTADSVYFEAQVPENKVSQISQGLSVDILVDALGGSTLKGTVQTINPVATSVARLYTVRVLVRDRADMLKPGMFGKGQMIVGVKRGVYVLPEQSVRQDGDESSVMVVVDGKAKKKSITKGETVGSSIYVTGLKQTDVVVIRGQDNLMEGTEVRIENSNGKSESDPAAAPKAEDKE